MRLLGSGTLDDDCAQSEPAPQVVPSNKIVNDSDGIVPTVFSEARDTGQAWLPGPPKF